MAEGIANYLGNGILKATSAGLNPAGFVNPLAIKVMEEIGIDISNYKSKQIDLNLLNETDIIIR